MEQLADSRIAALDLEKLTDVLREIDSLAAAEMLTLADHFGKW